MLKDVFCFSHDSKDELPGFGHNETLNNNINLNYKELVKIKNWRQILSPTYESSFFYDNLQWNTVNHAYIAQKIKNTDDTLYNLLSMNSNSTLSKLNGPILDVLFQIIHVDKKYKRTWVKIRKKIKKKIYTAFFKQNRKAKEIIILTFNAKLMYMDTKNIIKRMKQLETVRLDIIKKYVFDESNFELINSRPYPDDDGYDLPINVYRAKKK